MTKDQKTLVLIGAGSVKFTRGVLQHMIDDGGEWELRLVDINPESLDISARLSKKLVAAQDASITVRASEDRREMLPGTDAIVCTIGVGSRRAWELDVFVPRQFGIYYPTGDTYGPPGISRALRMIPPMVDIARDVEAMCPDALFINYANPMSAVCRAVYKTTSIQMVGQCIGVQGVHNRLSNFIDAPPGKVWSAAIGVNHLTWLTELRYGGQDAWPLVRQKMTEKPDVVARNRLTWELFQVFDAFPAVWDGHITEFFPGWHSEGAYYGRSLGLDPHPFERIIERDDRVFQSMADQAYDRIPLVAEDEVGEHSQLVEILRAVWDDVPGYYSVNLPNLGQAGNLPQGAILEGTTLINGSGYHPLSFGELPPGIAAILQRVIGVQELTVEAALQGDRQLVVQAMLADGDVRTKSEADALTDALLEAQREWLPQFFG